VGKLRWKVQCPTAQLVRHYETERQAQAMLDFYRSDKSNATHNILSLISGYTQLRKVGREYLGLCPLHSEKTPSFRVNANRSVFYCFGCHAGGDAIRFVELVEGVDFKRALQILGTAKGSPQPRRISLRNEISEWANQQIQKMDDRLRSLDEMIEDADELGDVQLAESLWIEQRILADLRDDLTGPQYATDFIAIKHVIEKITRSFE